MIDPEEILRRHGPGNTGAADVLLAHGRQVAQKALDVARGLDNGQIDFTFIQEAAWLHDIGVLHTHAPALGCHGDSPYVCHGILGRRLLEQEGLYPHGLVCERHVGTGISAEEIHQRKLPLPCRDMVPVSLEEKIICYADKFFSKNGHCGEKSVEEVLASLGPYGRSQVDRFVRWVERFEPRRLALPAARGDHLLSGKPTHG